MINPYLNKDFIEELLDKRIKENNPKRTYYVVKYQGQIINIPPAKGGFYWNKRAATCAISVYLRNMKCEFRRIMKATPTIFYQNRRFNARDYHESKELMGLFLEKARPLFTIEEMERGW